MEKQAVVRPGVTPDLEPAQSSCCKCKQVRARMLKAARDKEEKDEIDRLARQDATSRLAEDLNQ